MPLAGVHIDGYALDETSAISLGQNATSGRTAIFDSDTNEMTIVNSN